MIDTGGAASGGGGAAGASAGTPGAGGDGPSPNPAGCSQITGVLYCDDFEAGLNPMLTPVSAKGGMVAVDQTRPRSGKSSLHVKSLVPAYADGEVRLGSPVFPTLNNSFFLRAYVYYAPPAAADNVYLFRLDGLLPNTTTKVNAQMGCEGFPYNKPNDPNFKQLSTLIYHSDIHSADHFAYRTAAAPEVTFGRWACWEWQVDGPNHTWHVYVDGVEHFTRRWDGKAGTPWVVPSAKSLAIGVKHDHDEQPSGVEVWYDDLVIASSRIGCGPP